MDLGGIARQLADNCVYRSWDGRTLQLQLDPTHRHLQVGSSQQRLRLALQDLLDADVKLVIEAEAAQVDTPAMRQARAREERQREAESEMAADPLVKTMEERFGARLIPESVKPVDSTGSGK
jgi:DNA polymerase-3 subunit gamma/tau